MRALVLAALAAAVLAGRARANDDPRTLTYDLGTEVVSLDPDWAYDAASQFAVQQIYEPLISFDGSATDRFVPRLASVVPTVENGFLSRDGLTYRFPLRTGVRFHDGAEMTPEDARYSILRFLLMDRAGGPSPLLLEPLLGRSTVAGPDGRPDPAAYDEAARAVSIEGGALVLRLKKPFAPLLAVLADYAPVVSRAFVAAHGGWDGAEADWARYWNPSRGRAALFGAADGTGPFKLVAWDHGAKALLLARNDAYWRSPAALQTVRVETVEDPEARRARLANGDADVAQADARSAAAFRGLPGVVLDESALLETDDVILFNLDAAAGDNPWLGSGRLDGLGVPPDLFSDPAVRRAFACAFDADALLRDGFGGRGTRSYGPIPPSLLGGGPPRSAPVCAPGAAEKALRAARGGRLWREGFLLPMAYATGFPDRAAACRALQTGLAALNPKFRVDCRGVPQSRLLADLQARRLSAFVASWVLDYPDPHAAVEPFLGSDGFFAKPLGYSNPRADALIAKAAAETEPSKRRALYEELQSLAVRDAAQIYTIRASGVLARRASVRGWVFNPMLPYGSLYEVSKLP